jgi:hypothetical protein
MPQYYGQETMETMPQPKDSNYSWAENNSMVSIEYGPSNKVAIGGIEFA